MAQIVTIGEILVEIMATRIGQTFLEPGLFAGPYPSGAPAIFADQAARVGAATALISCVGPDDFGTLNLNRLQASGVEVGCDPEGARHDDGQRLRHLSGRRRARLHLQHRQLGCCRPRRGAARARPVPRLPVLPRHGLVPVQRADRGGRAARRRAGQGGRCPDLVRPQHPQGAAGSARGRRHHCGRARGQRRPAAERRRPRPSLPRPVGSRGRGEPARRRPADGAAEEGRAGQRLLRRRPADRDPGLPGRGGRPDRRRRLLRRNLRRLPGAGRATGAGAASGQRGRRPGGRRRRGRWRATPPWPSSTAFLERHR